MKARARRGVVPENLRHPTLVPNAKVPPDLSETVTATLWQKHGDHPAVIKVKPFYLEDVNEPVTVKGGMLALYKGRPPISVQTLKQNGAVPREGQKFFQLRPVDAIVRRTDPETGYLYDHLVMPGFYIIENHSDRVVWALSPHHFRAWFEPIEEQ